jgi:hypothetical protein
MSILDKLGAEVFVQGKPPEQCQYPGLREHRVVADGLAIDYDLRLRCVMASSFGLTCTARRRLRGDDWDYSLSGDRITRLRMTTERRFRSLCHFVLARLLTARTVRDCMQLPRST